MILEKSTGYWATGIELRWDEHRTGWTGRVEYFDDGFPDDHADTRTVSTQGVLYTRYAVTDGNHVSGLTAAIDVLITDATTLGLSLRSPGGDPPRLYYKGDGEHEDSVPPAGWRGLLREQAERIGWSTYGYEPTLYCWAVWDGEPRELVSTASGYLLKTREDALAAVTDGPGDLAWTREHNWLERVSPERLDSLADWDAKTEQEKAGLRPFPKGTR